MRAADVEPRRQATQRAKPLVMPRRAFIRLVCVAATMFVILIAYSIHNAWRAVGTHREAAAAAHASSLRLVRLAMELQAELDTQEDHDRWTLQLYLRLEKETMPALQREMNSAIQACPDAARTRAGRNSSSAPWMHHR